MGSISRTQKAGALEVWQPATPAVKYTTLQVGLLSRLQRTTRLRREQNELLSAEGLRLLDWAIYSTFCDCLQLGVGHEARSIIHVDPETYAN